MNEDSYSKYLFLAALLYMAKYIYIYYSIYVALSVKTVQNHKRNARGRRTGRY